MKYLILFFLTLKLVAFDINATYVDQFDQTTIIVKEDRIILVVFDKSEYDDVNHFLETKSKEYLVKHHIRLASDISTMPSTVYSLFAQPNMQKLNWKLILLKDIKIAKKIEHKEGKLTLHTLHEKKIISTKFIDTTSLQKELPK